MNIQDEISKLNERFQVNQPLSEEDLNIIKSILDEIGWPKISTVGPKSAAWFWVLAIDGIDPSSELYRLCWKLMRDCEEMQSHKSYYEEFKSKL